MGVSGGAVFPPIQGAISDKFDTRSSYFIAIPCFLYITLWAVYIWHLDGRKFRVTNESAAQVDAENFDTAPSAGIALGYRGAGEDAPVGDVKEDVYKVERS
jgi:FHS family L-fucose permease-like MFS transporter